MAAAVPAPRADDDPRRAAADAVLEPVRTLQREVGDDAIPWARRQSLHVLDAAQRAKRARGTHDERGRGARVRRYPERDDAHLVHDDGRGAAERDERAVTAVAAGAGAPTVDLQRQAVHARA